MDNNFIEHYLGRLITSLALVLLITGTVVYHIVEKLSWVDAWYFSVITLATVGYGDISPQTDFGKIFTTIYVLLGVGIIVAFTSMLVRRAGERHQRKKESQS